ncbi:F-box protein [Camellia lanceoleosa]|uniref:F-box protein n=1 Tax=Camellia lanceoleosa TaxID=1840588 RepID=A0ACC0F4N7_9ERIC|nr:F-box protein [Camellia lanceoleosa]
MDDSDSEIDHKLCGFSCSVLTMTPPRTQDLSETLPLNTRCYVFGGDGSEVGLQSENGVFLSVINANARALVSTLSAPESGEGWETIQRERVCGVEEDMEDRVGSFVAVRRLSQGLDRGNTCH